MSTRVPTKASFAALEVGPAALSKVSNSIIEHIEELATASDSPPQEDDTVHVTAPHDLSVSAVSLNAAIIPQAATNRSKIHILDLPVELIELLCVQYLDTVTCTCLGLTCHPLFNITEHLYPYQVNLHMRTLGPDKKCLGHLLTDWMAPKYSFDHSWGKFLPKRYYLNDEVEVERRWRQKESWRRIRTIADKNGAAIAYERTRHGF
ncbi:uncharacterized protein PAC_00226 [Phialocephala subalpina]|uniref:F-box domain-containing protein n=1 Tax=Phialocephala subalpina TaxID=576137 RepID=A0A1L7WC49_9HELO|nr:uncharacterized protein PAC_00226 [Phialocephala subalpina]